MIMMTCACVCVCGSGDGTTTVTVKTRNMCTKKYAVRGSTQFAYFTVSNFFAKIVYFLSSACDDVSGILKLTIIEAVRVLIQCVTSNVSNAQVGGWFDPSRLRIRPEEGRGTNHGGTLQKKMEKSVYERYRFPPGLGFL